MSKTKKVLLAVLGSFLLAASAIAAVVQFKFLGAESKLYTVPAFTIAEQVKAADVALGRRIYHVRGGCVDCHGEDLAGIKVMEDPAMGTIHGANITPANLATWTDEQVAAAVRYGVHKSGRSLRFMPSMDWVEMSSGDVAALVAYMRTVPAVDRPSVEPVIGPVAKVLSVLGEMPVMFPAAVIEPLPPGFRDKPAEAPTAEFGRYLAAGCTGCHGAEMRGGKIPGGAPDWPAAASVRLGADSRWTEANFKEMLRTGVSPLSGQKLRAPMPVALLAQLDDTEATALWLHLSALK